MKKLLLCLSFVTLFVAMASMNEAKAVTNVRAYACDAITDEDPCPQITELSVSDIQGTSAKINWVCDAAVEGMTYTLEYSVSGQNIWDLASNNISSPIFLLGDLEPLTTYQVRVKANCEEASAWDTVTFTTKCLAGGEIAIGSGSRVSYDLPSHSMYNYGYSQQIFTSAELGLATNFSALAINMNTVTHQRQFDIYLMPTTQTEITSWLPTTTAQLVYTGTPTLTEGWNTFNFIDTFAYNGTDNLVLIIIDKTGSYHSGNLGVVHIAHDNCARNTYRDTSAYSISAVPAAAGNALNERNNVIFFGECYTEIPCVKPNMYVDNVTGTTADVIWVPGYEETQWEMQYKTVDETTWTSVPNPGNGIQTLTSLIPNVLYQVRMRAMCDGQNPSEWVSEEFRTVCGMQPIPFSENFNSYGIGQSAFPSCWTLKNTYNYLYPYISTPNNLDSTGGSLYFFASNSTFNAAVTPELNANVSTLTVSFYLRVTNLANGMIVGVMDAVTDDPTDMSTFTPVDTMFCSATSTFEYKEVYMNTYSGTGKYIVFKNFITTTGYTDRMMWLDDIVIDQSSSCNLPTNLEVMDVTETSVQLAWVENGQAQNWNIEYHTADFEPGTNTGVSMSVNANPYTITDLEAGTTYYFYVQALCEGDAESSWCGPVHVSTLCEVFNLPFVETFNELTSGIPDCWDNREGTTTNEEYKWGYLNSGFEGHGVYFNSYFNASGNTNALKTPRINIGAPSTLKFYYKNPTGGDLSVYALANGTQTLLVGGLVDTAVWTVQTCDLSAYNGQVIQISFVGTSNYGSGNAYIYLDSVSIKANTPGPQPECNAPTNVTSSDITKNSAVINWNQEGTPDSWTLKYKKESTDTWTTLANLTSRSYTLTNLDPLTRYNVQVIAVCGSTTSDPSSTITFETLPDGVSEYVNNTVLYPNPTTGQFRIVNSELRIENVEVYDIYGKLLNSVEVNDHSTMIDVSGYSSGIYFTRIYTEKGLVVKQIVKK